LKSLPSSAVAVCGAPSWLTQITVAPTGMTTSPGLNTKFAIGTVSSFCRCATGWAWGFAAVTGSGVLMYQTL
jgi:hypothetical protein